MRLWSNAMNAMHLLLLMDASASTQALQLCNDTANSWCLNDDRLIHSSTTSLRFNLQIWNSTKWWEERIPLLVLHVNACHISRAGRDVHTLAACASGGAIVATAPDLDNLIHVMPRMRTSVCLSWNPRFHPQQSFRNALLTFEPLSDDWQIWRRYAASRSSCSWKI